MGTWGVKAHECDRACDYLIDIEEKILKPIDFKCFDVNFILEFMKNQIMEEVNKEIKKCSRADKEYYMGIIFPRRYCYITFLVAECVVDYLLKGKYVIHDYDTDTEIKITEFIFSNSDLEYLSSELQKFLEPEHFEYKAWEESKSFENWQAHINMLCENINKKKGA